MLRRIRATFSTPAASIATVPQIADWSERKARPSAVHSSTTSRSSGTASRSTAAVPMRVHVSSALHPTRFRGQPHAPGLMPSRAGIDLDNDGAAGYQQRPTSFQQASDIAIDPDVAVHE